MSPAMLSIGEVFVDRADERVVRLGDDAVVGDLGDGAAVQDGGHAGAATAAQHAVDAVAVDVGRRRGRRRRRRPRSSISTISSKSSRVEVAVGPGAAHEGEEVVLAPVLAGALGDDLLREDVERRDRRVRRGRGGRRGRRGRGRRTRPARRGSSGRGAPAACRPRAWPERPTRCRKVAMLRGEPIWQTRSMVPMSMPSSSEAVATSACSSPALRRCSTRRRRSLREAAVVRADVLLAEALARAGGRRARRGGAC